MNPAIRSVTAPYARSGSSARSNELGMRTMLERANDPGLVFTPRE